MGTDWNLASAVKSALAAGRMARSAPLAFQGSWLVPPGTDSSRRASPDPAPTIATVPSPAGSVTVHGEPSVARSKSSDGKAGPDWAEASIGGMSTATRTATRPTATRPRCHQGMRLPMCCGLFFLRRPHSGWSALAITLSLRIRVSHPPRVPRRPPRRV